MTAARKHLPQRRYSEQFSLRHWNMEYDIGVGRYDEGPIGELFINCGKSGDQAETLAKDSAVILSISLQYGVPIEAFAKAIQRDADGKPTGPIGAILDRLASEEAVLERAVRDLA